VTEPSVVIDATSGIWQVTLNRPAQGNALSVELVSELDDVFVRAERAEAEAVVMEGSGRHFSTGFDLSHVHDETDDSLLARFVRIELLLQRVARAPFLTVAIARGRAMGAGADLFAACRLRLVDADASFAFPGAKGFGLVLGTRRLASLVGASTCLQWVESASTIAADDALRAGLVSAITQGPQEAREAIAARRSNNTATTAAPRSARDTAA